MSDGAKTGSRKPHYTQVMKDEIERLKAENEALRSGQAPPVVTTHVQTIGVVPEITMPPPEGPFSIVDPVRSVSTPPKPKPLVEVFAEQDAAKVATEAVDDPLAWITEDTDAVYLVGKETFLQSTIHKIRVGFKCEIDYPKSLKFYQDTVWGKCPFVFEGRNPQETADLQHINRHHFHFVAEREWADEIFEYPRNPEPKKAIIAVEDFGGIHRATGWTTGKKSTLAQPIVRLREWVRHSLQLNSGRLWINKGHHIDEPMVDEQNPNPYSTYYAGAKIVAMS